jgi:hypothetical protein
MIKGMWYIASDMIRMFITIMAGGLMSLCEIASQIACVLQKLTYVVLVNAMEMLSDVQFICGIMYMLLLASVSSVSLYMSKCFLSLAKRTHAQSEQLVHELWMH